MVCFKRALLHARPQQAFYVALRAQIDGQHPGGVFETGVGPGVEQNLRGFEGPGLRGQVQGGAALVIGDVGVGAATQQQVHQTPVAAVRGQVQRGVAVLGGEGRAYWLGLIGVCLEVEEQGGQLVVPVVDGCVDGALASLSGLVRGRAYAVGEVGLGCALEQQTGGLELAGEHCAVEGRPAELVVLLVGEGWVVGEQLAEHGELAVAAGLVDAH